MKTILIATVGTREIKFAPSKLDSLFNARSDRADFFDNKGNPYSRYFGKLLNEKKIYPDYRNAVTLPILEPVINYIGEKIDKICLVVTDQTDEIFRKTDTIEYGKLIEKLLLDKKWKNIPTKFTQEQILEMIVIRENVIYLDSQFEFLREFLRRPVPITDYLNEANKIYLCAQGGIDAINTSLMLNLLNKYGNKVVIFNVNENGNCNEIRIRPMLEKERMKLNAESLVKHYYYDALEMIDELPENIKSLASYGKNRLLFDFNKATKVIDKLEPSLRTYGDQLKSQIKLSTDSERLKELYFNSKVKWIQQSYIDFLLRFFRIVEEICKAEAIRKLDGFSFRQHHWESDFTKFLESQEKLKIFMNNETVYGQPLNYRVKNPTIEILLVIIKFFSSINSDKEAPNDEKSDMVYNLINRVKCLAQLRNNSIGAHSFDPVSREIIEKELQKNKEDYTPDMMFAEIESIIECRSSPFDELNQKIISLIQDL